MKKTIALLAASIMFAISLTGCGALPNTVFSVDDLEGKTIGAQLGTTGYIYAEDEVEGATVEHLFLFLRSVAPQPFMKSLAMLQQERAIWMSFVLM